MFIALDVKCGYSFHILMKLKLSLPIFWRY